MAQTIHPRDAPSQKTTSSDVATVRALLFQGQWLELETRQDLRQAGATIADSVLPHEDSAAPDTEEAFDRLELEGAPILERTHLQPDSQPSRTSTARSTEATDSASTKAARASSSVKATAAS